MVSKGSIFYNLPSTNMKSEAPILVIARTLNGNLVFPFTNGNEAKDFANLLSDGHQVSQDKVIMIECIIPKVETIRLVNKSLLR